MFIFLLFFLWPNLLFAESAMQMTPLQSELLKNPILLSGDCSGVTITEWQGKSSKEKIQTVDSTCKKAFSEFKKFVKKKKITLDFTSKFSLKISFLSVGTEKRSLNDINFRFSSRTKEYDEDGDVIGIWGYHQRSSNYIYVFNLFDNPSFETVLAHEFFHALSFQYGLFNLHMGNKDKKDEKMAEEFTLFIGLGK